MRIKPKTPMDYHRAEKPDDMLADLEAKHGSSPTSGSEPNIHSLKTWPEYWMALASGNKTFEARKNDRNFKVGDTLRLWHYDPKTGEENGACIEADVTYVLYGPAFGVEDGWCVMALRVTWTQKAQNS